MSGWRRALEPEYVINLIGGRRTGSISMENAVSGPENTQRTFPARPTLCHNCKFRNIPALTISTSLTSPVTAARPSHVLYPPSGQSSRRPNGHSRSLTVGNLISYPAPQSPGTRTLPRGSIPAYSTTTPHHALPPLLPPPPLSLGHRQSPPLSRRRPICVSEIQGHLSQRTPPFK